MARNEKQGVDVDKMWYCSDLEKEKRKRESNIEVLLERWETKFKVSGLRMKL